MKNAIHTDNTFISLVDDCVRIRKTGDEAIVKRSDARDFIPDQLKGVQISEEKVLHISLGYFERLLRKLAAEFGDISIGQVALEKYAEGCGVFAGKLFFLLPGGKQQAVDFHWEGRGDIETTWDNFSKWEIC